MGRKGKKATRDAHAAPRRAARRKNAAELYRYFFEESPPIERFPRLPGTPPGRLLEFQ